MDQQTNSDIFDYSISPTMAANLKEAARWCRFVSIVVFIMMGFLLIGGVVAAPTIVSLFNSVMPTAIPLVAGALVAIIVVAVLFGVFLYSLLYRFSSFTRRAVDLNDEGLFIKGLRSLKIYFIIYGILTALGALINLVNLFR